MSNEHQHETQETENDDPLVREHKEEKLGRRDQAEGDRDAVENTPDADQTTDGRANPPRANHD